MGFFEVTQAGQNFAERTDMFGESFTYQNVSLVGVFDQVQLDYQFSDASFRKITALICVTSKTQWAAANLVPANRENVTYGNIAYPIQQIAGLNTAGEPAYTLTLFRLT